MSLDYGEIVHENFVYSVDLPVVVRVQELL